MTSDTPTFPDVFPHPTIQGYGLTAQETIARTQMDSGVARQRRRFTKASSIISVRWIMPEFEFGLFDAWYVEYAEEGASFFNMNIQSGLGYKINHVRFTAPYTATLLGNNIWEINANLEVRSLETFSKSLLDFFIGTGQGKNFLGLATRFHKLVTITLPDALRFDE